MKPWLDKHFNKEQIHVIWWIDWHTHIIWWEFENSILNYRFTLGQNYKSLSQHEGFLISPTPEPMIPDDVVHSIQHNQTNFPFRFIFFWVGQVFYWTGAKQARGRFWHTGKFIFRYFLEKIMMWLNAPMNTL